MSTLTRMTRNALDAAEKAKPAKDGILSDPKKLMSDPKKIGAAGLAVAALPVAVEQIAKHVAPKVSDVGEQAKDKLSEAGDKVSDVVGEGVKDAAVSKLKPDGLSGGGLLSKLTPGSSDDGDGQGGDERGGGILSKLKPGSSDDDNEGRAAPGYGGGGRRMPIQQSVDVAVPIKVAYNRFTQFEEWPKFMHRVESADQSDDTTLDVSSKVWGITRRFEAEIVEQRPDERIEWNATGGIAHTGVVSFHELAPRLTHIEVSMDIEPQGLVNKFGRGARFAKRAVRGDLHRFKALVELDEEAADGGWRGTIEDGKVKRRTERRSNSSGKSSGKRRRSQSRNGSGSSSKRGRARSST